MSSLTIEQVPQKLNNSIASIPNGALSNCESQFRFLFGCELNRLGSQQHRYQELWLYVSGGTERGPLSWTLNTAF